MIISRLDGDLPPNHIGPRQKVVRVGKARSPEGRGSKMLVAYRRGRKHKGKKY